MKKIVFFTAMLAFVAGTTIAVSSYDSKEVIETSAVEDGNKEKKDKKSEDKDKKSETTATTTTKSNDCASKKACCKKDAKANCDDKKKDK